MWEHSFFLMKQDEVLPSTLQEKNTAGEKVLHCSFQIWHLWRIMQYLLWKYLIVPLDYYSWTISFSYAHVISCYYFGKKKFWKKEEFRIELKKKIPLYGHMDPLIEIYFNNKLLKLGPIVKDIQYTVVFWLYIGARGFFFLNFTPIEPTFFSK